MLNAKEIEKEGLIVLDNAKGKFAQVGYDLSIKSISKLKGNGQVLKAKTVVNDLESVEMSHLADSYNEVYGWLLEPGTYDVMCNEGCDIAPNRTAMVRQRSSI